MNKIKFINFFMIYLLFYFLVIGLPIIWVISIIIHLVLLIYHQEKKYFILLSILFGPLGLIISLFYILRDD